MNKAIRLALAGASVLALSALAQSHATAERMSGRYTGVQKSTAVAATRRAVPAQVRSGTDWDAQIGFDRASSPFGHGGY